MPELMRCANCGEAIYFLSEEENEHKGSMWLHIENTETRCSTGGWIELPPTLAPI